MGGGSNNRQAMQALLKYFVDTLTDFTAPGAITMSGAIISHPFLSLIKKHVDI